MTKISFRIRAIIEEHKRKVLDRLKDKVNHAISNNKPLLCIGFHLPDFNIGKEFTKPVYFCDSSSLGKQTSGTLISKE
ncbi:MAG TPA: hypothetical protein VF233_05660 [Nitrososphaeraceae archaeon]